MAGDINNTSFHYSCHTIIMHRIVTDANKHRIGLGKKATEAGAARLAARAAVSDEVGVAAEHATTPIRTSPRRDKRAKSDTQPSVASSRRGKKKKDDTPSQLLAESQSLLSPADASSTHGAPPLLSVIHENVESQITHGTDFPSDKSESSDDDDGVPDGIANSMSEEALLNFFENNENEEEVDREQITEGLEDLNDYSSDKFSVNERRHYFMDRAAISTQNRAAVEFVYMVEAETLTRDSGTRGLNDVKTLLHSKYIELIRQIPTNHFSEFGLREGMIDKYYGAKKGGASGFYTKVLDVKKKVQAVTRLIDGIGTPLSKIPSGRGLNDVKDQFILNDYKAVMGAVSIVSSSFLWLHNVDFNCAFFSY